MEPLEKKYKIGILGAGQLGLYLAHTCDKKDISWCIFYQNEDEPGAIQFKKNAVKLLKEPAKRKKQIERCEYIILESEFFPYDELVQYQSKFIPNLDSYKHFSGKINQRKFYNSLGMKAPKHWIINDISELDHVDQFPVIMKKDRFSYDGNGNRECHGLADLHRYILELGLPVLVEEKLNLKKEFAVGLVSNSREMIELPLTETIQKNHICHYVLGPIILPPLHHEKLEIEINKLKNANLFGLFAFEFFITDKDEVIINEGAARPHNSQHLTMNLIDHSQFDYLIDLAITPKKLSAYIYKAKMGAMINLLGKHDKENPNLILTEIPEDYPHEVYLYGKKIGRIGRKLGHLNVLNNQHNFNEFSKVLDSIREGYDL